MQLQFFSFVRICDLCVCSPVRFYQLQVWAVLILKCDICHICPYINAIYDTYKAIYDYYINTSSEFMEVYDMYEITQKHCMY